MSEIPLVIYHANCYDGFTAAWIARKAIRQDLKLDCELFPAKYGEPPPDLEQYSFKGRQVYILDFSYPRETMIRMHGAAGCLRVLDHHKTAQEDCAGLDFCNFDMDKAGCRLAWEYFFPGKPVPDWIKRIEDRDLWRFKYPDTKYVHAYVATIPMTLKHWDNINELSLQEMIAGGLHIARYIETYIKKAVEQARIVHIEGDLVAVLNIPYQNISEMASLMLIDYQAVQYAMGYFQRADGKWQYSLRSRKDFDVSKIAKRYGGGGHAQAAGFETSKLLMDLQ